MDLMEIWLHILFSVGSFLTGGGLTQLLNWWRQQTKDSQDLFQSQFQNILKQKDEQFQYVLKQKDSLLVEEKINCSEERKRWATEIKTLTEMSVKKTAKLNRLEDLITELKEDLLKGQLQAIRLEAELDLLKRKTTG